MCYFRICILTNSVNDKFYLRKAQPDKLRLNSADFYCLCVQSKFYLHKKEKGVSFEDSSQFESRNFNYNVVDNTVN